MENDLISRVDAIEAIRSMTITIGGNNVFPDNVKSSVLDALEFAPSVEAEPVRHGRWDEVWCFDYMDYTHFCSECHYDALTKEGTMHDEVLTAYCPNCGAKMDAKEDA